MVRIFIIFLAVFIGFLNTTIAKEPSVVVTIAPLHSLVQGVLGEEIKAELLVTGRKSPHGFQLKPSHLSKLNQADIVFYVSDMLEPFIARVPFDENHETRVVSMIIQKNLDVLMIREGGVWAPHEDHEDHEEHEAGEKNETHEKHGSHDEHDESEHEREHNHNHDHERNEDPHLWLDPQNAISMITVIRDTLISKFPNKAATFRQNALVLTARLRMLDDELQEIFEPVKETAFIVLHDAYQYLEHRYKLTSVGSVQVSAGQQISAKRVKELRHIISDRNAVCLFREPQFTDRILNVIAEGSTVQIGTLDPMGSDIKTGPNHYFEMQQQLARNLVDCLGRSS